MKRVILIINLALITLWTTQAQDVFKKYGHKKEMLTLSKGKYQEVFKNDEEVQIGTVLLNTKTNKVVKLLQEDTTKKNYNAELSSRFLTVDPLAEKFPEISPYAYCANNPVIFVDPDGKDWVLRIIDGTTEVYYDRDVKSTTDVVNKYGENSGVIHMGDGTTITRYDAEGNMTAQFTFTNDSKDNKYGTVTDMNGNKLDNTKITYGADFTIFGTSDNSVNAETLHKNYFDSSYIGPNNPKTYGNGTESSTKDSYQYKPTWSPTEMAAFKHDLNYDAAGASGFTGTLSPSTSCADMQLISDCRRVLNNPKSSAVEKSRARKIIAGFSIVNFFKPAL